MVPKIFLSYARNDDEPFAWRLYAALDEAGFDVWFDRVSMPARQLSFHQEIRDEITARDRLILVVGPGAVGSDYVTQEWRFAYFEAMKCVNPIVRLDGVDAMGKRIDGYSLIPEDLRLIHAEDFRDDAQFDVHRENLIRQLSDPPPPAGKLVAVPELPPHYLDQPARLAALRDILLADLQKPVVVSGAAARVGLQGMGGIGKSVLASALAHRPEVRRAFPDGVYWVTLGQEPNVTNLQRGLARALGDDAHFTSINVGKEKLRSLLAERAALLVLDDVWQRGHAEALNVMGPRGRLLLTTRDAGLVTALAARENHYQVHLLTEAESEALLARAAGVEIPELPEEAVQIIEECGRLPLGLALCGGMVHEGTTWRDVLEALRERDLEFLSDSHPAEEQHRSIWKAMDVSIRALPESERERFVELAVFALDTGAPEAAVETLWGHTAALTPRRTRELLVGLRRRSLIAFDETARHVTLHDLLHSFAAGMAEKHLGSPAELHRRLLDAYWKRCPEGWPSGPDDGYLQQNLVGHLLSVGDRSDAVAMLSDLLWVEAKCKAGHVFELQDDYRQTILAMPEAQEKLRAQEALDSAMASWARVLSECARSRRMPTPEETIPSVTICTEDMIASMAEREAENPGPLSRIEALSQFVVQQSYALLGFGRLPGFVAQHAFNNAPAGVVHCAGADRIRQTREPLLVRVWPDNTVHDPIPACLMVLAGHTNGVPAVCMTADGQTIVSACADCTMRFWDARTGECMRVLRTDSSICCLAMTPDGGIVVTDRPRFGRGDGIAIWDVATGVRREPGTPRSQPSGPREHRDVIRAVAITSDGALAISASQDHTLIVWDAATGNPVRCLKGHNETVANVAAMPDCRRVVSSSKHCVRVWDLETGECTHEWLRGSRAKGTQGPTDTAAHSSSIWDFDSGLNATMRESLGERFWYDTMTPDGRHFLDHFVDELIIGDLSTGEELRRIRVDHGSGGPGNPAIDCARLTPDGSRAITGGFDGTVRIWDVRRGRSSPLADHHVNRHSGRPSAVSDVLLSENGCSAYSAGNFDQTLRKWNPRTGRCIGELHGHTVGIAALGLDPPDRMVSASGDRTVRVWDTATDRCVSTWCYGRLDPHSISIARGFLAISDLMDPPVLICDLESGRLECRLEEGKRPVTLLGNRHLAVSGSLDCGLCVWDVDTGELIRRLHDCPDYVSSILGISHQALVVAGTYEGPIRVWDVDSGEPVATLEGHNGTVKSVRAARDVPLIVSAGDDKTVRVWNLNTMELVAGANLSATPTCCAIDAGGTTIAAGLDTGEVEFYRARGLL